MTATHTQEQPATRSTAAVAAATAVPLLWLPLTLLHPLYMDRIAADGQVGLWTGVHVVQLALTPLLALAILHLLVGLPGTAATVARVAVVIWASVFAAFESIAGIATGVLVGGGHDAGAAYLFADRWVGGAGSLLGFVAHPLWAVVAIAAALALRAAGAARTPQIALYVSCLFVLTHATPSATVAMAAIAVALWSAPRQPGPAPAPAP